MNILRENGGKGVKDTKHKYIGTHTHINISIYPSIHLSHSPHHHLILPNSLYTHTHTHTRVNGGWMGREGVRGERDGGLGS